MVDDPRARSYSVMLRWYDRAVSLLSFGGLAGIIGTTIYCIAIRTHYERSYVAALAVALFSLFVMLIAWAQQVIAARDLATWRDMVEWQIRAARRKVAQDLDEDEDEEHDHYFECLVEALITDMQSASQDDRKP